VSWKYKVFLVVFTVIVALDQWTKHLVHTKFYWGESIPIIDSFFALTYVRNSGAAFGILHRAPATFRDPFFIIVPILVLLIITVIFVRLTQAQRLSAFALSLIYAGAIGNLIDRLRFKYVIDFLDFHWKEVYHWPAFNVADSSIVVGVGFLLLESFFSGKSKVSMDNKQVA